MRFAVATWTYSDDESLPEWIHRFADDGFDTVSLHPRQFSRVMPEHHSAVAEALEARDLQATVHGSCDMERGLVEAIVQALGKRLRAFTIDRAVREDSRGKLYDAGRMAKALRDLCAATAGTEARLAIEDFPLDEMALQHFKAELGDVYDDPRTGILIDVGHMHMRLSQSGYFTDISVEEYFSRLPLAVVEVHLHDNDGKKDQHGYFGLGTVPFEDVAAALKAVGFDGVSTIEIAPDSCGSTPDEAEGQAKESLDTWRRLME